jgi:hypothetical protein
VSLFGEFRVPADAFALHHTLQAVSDPVVEIDRVVAAEDRLTPYCWVSGADPDEAAAATADDPSVRDPRRLDEFEGATLYRVEWTENIETLEGVRPRRAGERCPAGRARDAAHR